ncbi:MAG: aldo/keto reductase [Bacteroidota bacterium]
MNNKQLGKSELLISEISLGTMSLGIEYPTAKSLLHRALDLGVNFFDTADLYDKGLNEEILGKSFQGIRNSLILATKVGNQLNSDGSAWTWNPTKAYILKAVDDSLRRLKTDYIDLYQLHGGTIDDPIDETIEAFEELVQIGKIRYYGISSIRPNVIRAYVSRSNIVSVMTQYSLLDRRPEEETLGLLEENKVGVLVRGAVAKGLLGGKASKDYLEHSQGAVHEVQKTISEYTLPSRSMAQTAIAYASSHPAVSTIVSGASRLSQIEENVETSKSPPLTEAELKKLKDSTPFFPYRKHR